jgi:hypothetical protein
MEEREPQEEGQVKEFISLLQQYVGKRFDLLRLEGIDIITRVFSSLIVYVVLAILLFLILMMLSVVGGLFFASLFHSYLGGFGLIVSLYVLLFIIIFSMRTYLVEKVFAPQFLKMIFNNDDEDEDS